MALLGTSVLGSLTKLQSKFWGWDLIEMLNWGRIHSLLLISIVERINLLPGHWTEELSSLLAFSGRLPSLPCYVGLFASSKPIGESSASKMKVTILCNIIAEVTSYDIWVYILNLQFYWFKVIGPALKERRSHKGMNNRRWGPVGVPDHPR